VFINSEERTNNMPKLKNENSLAGYECPQCKSQEPLWFSTHCFTKWTDDGTEESENYEILDDDDGYGLCEKCGHRAPVAKFKIDE
jgi:DNA-directed RNA polymerase subunit RPC12/RpoP